MNIQRAIDRNNAVGNVAGKIDPQLEIDMLQEEANEFTEAILQNDRVEVVDGLIDIMFVAVGTLHKMGLTKEQIERSREEVCDSNFSKLPFKKQENGKVLKGDNFFRPDLAKIIKKN